MTDDESTSSVRRTGNGRDHRSLLERAGVIGAESIAHDDPGSRLIPASVPTPSSDAGLSGEDPWAAAGVPDNEVGAWERVCASPTTAATLRRLGADPEAVGAAPVPAEELVGWLWHGFAVEEVSDWLGHGSVRTAARRRAAGLTPRNVTNGDDRRRRPG